MPKKIKPNKPAVVQPPRTTTPQLLEAADQESTTAAVVRSHNYSILTVGENGAFYIEELVTGNEKQMLTKKDTGPQ